MKNIEAYNLIQAIKTIQNDPKRVPVKFGYALAINGKRLQDLAETFESMRAQIIKHYAELDGEGNPVIEGDRYRIADEAAFNHDVLELQNLEVAVDLHLVDIESLPSEIEPILMQVLLPMIREP